MIEVHTKCFFIRKIKNERYTNLPRNNENMQDRSTHKMYENCDGIVLN